MEEHEQLDEHALFAEALECPDEATRRALLDSRCAGDDRLRRRIERLLELHASSGNFLEEPAAARPLFADGLYRVGMQIDGYELVEQIGEGGMGLVFAAKQETPIRRTVALKIVKPGMDSRRLLARFEAERQVLALMDHPNIARVLDAGSTPLGHPYFVMEIVRGVPITEFCRSRQLSIEARLRLFLTVCDAVQHAHQKGIIHRDLKPSNILVMPRDDGAFAKVIDFGIAKAVDCRLSIDSGLTGVSQVVGTPLYMSPEQAEAGNLDIDIRADVYSLGTILYELLTDTTPFEGNRLTQLGPEEVMRVIRSIEPPPPSTRVKRRTTEASGAEPKPQGDARQWIQELRGELDWIVLKSLEQDRERRYQTAKDFADDIRRYLEGEAVLACPPSVTYRLRKTLSKHRRSALAAAGAALLLVAAATVTSLLALQASRAEQQATEAQRRAETEAAVSAAISDFLRNDLLGQANPYVNTDRELSLRELLDRATERIAGRFNGKPLVEAEIRMTLGTAYLHLGEFDQARSHFQRVVQLRRDQLGPRHRDTLKADFFLARVDLETGHVASAADSLRRTFQRQRDSLGKDDPDTLVTMDWLAWCYALQSRYEESEALYRRATRDLRRVLGDDHPDTLECLDGQARLFAYQGKYEEAETLQRSVMETRRRVLGERHPHFLDSLSSLGDIKMLQGDAEAALQFYRQAAEVRRQVLGSLHPMTLGDEARINRALAGLNQFQEAQQRLEELHRLQRQRLGSDDARTLFTALRLAKVYKAQGYFERARDLLERALADRIEHAGTKDELAVRVMRELAVVHLWLGDYDQARKLRKSIVELRKALHGERHYQFVRALLDYAHILQESRLFEEAERIVRQAIAIQDELTGPQSREAFVARLRLGYVLKKARRLAEAEEVLRQLWEQGPRVWGSDHSSVATAGNQLAAVLAYQKRWGEAEEIAAGALKMRRTLFGDNRLGTAYSLETLAEIYLGTGRLVEAIDVLRQNVEVRRRVQGDCHQGTVDAMTMWRRAMERAEAMNVDYSTTTDRRQCNQWLLEFLAAQKQRLGRPTEQLVAELCRTAASHEQAGNLKLAESLYRELVQIRRQYDGTQTDIYIAALRDLMRVLRKQQRCDEAVPFAIEMWKTTRKIHGDHAKVTRETARSLVQLGKTLERCAEWNAASAVYHHVYQWRSVSQYSNIAAIVSSICAAARCYESAGNWERAYELRSEELRLRNMADFTSSPPVLCRILVAETLLELGRLAEAERHSRKCLAIASQSKWPSRDTVFAGTILAEICMKRGDRAEARRVLEQCHQGLADFVGRGEVEPRDTSGSPPSDRSGQSSRRANDSGWTAQVPTSMTWRLRYHRFFGRLARLSDQLEQPDLAEFWRAKRQALGIRTSTP